MELKNDKEKGWVLDGEPITSQDIMFLASGYATMHKDKDWQMALGYLVMLKEPGHNGFWLKSYHTETQNKKEAIRK